MLYIHHVHNKWKKAPTKVGFVRSGIRAAVIGATAIASLGIGALPASAAVTSCPNDGYITRGDRCTTLSNGYLSIHLANSGTYVHVGYYRKSGGSLTGKLGWERGGTNHWSSSINMSKTPFHYDESWSASKSCSATYGKLYASGQTYATPPAYNC
ncbi:hypothetical protein [Streptomyces lomondensis]|uniref:Secreted protein n=1 Tax=Streptomyces lomondensis TaxID=68229 RepID=A0ABQ2XM86_9ACTN|nr:hypothetical protein [Streptomyces lomondensis]MCF0076427.1 hypothetical protein [Streptomyces lomondensis]GGX24614.1 hypothetical protein GCM10010383_63780 [Streptomyces lomondensis]